MANIKITDLNASTDPASTDVLAIVDVGADETKKITIADLLENAGSGTAAAPGISFDGDSNTGIYRPGADQLAISTAGTGRLFVDSSGNVGIGGSATHALTVTTSGTSGVKINTAEYGLLDVSDGTSTIRLQNLAGTSRLATATNHPLVFATNEVEHLRITASGQLSHIGNGSVGSPAVSFNGSAPSNSLVVDSTGKVGVGVTAPSTNLHIRKDHVGFTGIYLENRSGSVGSYSGISFGTNTSGTNQWFVTRENSSTANLDFALTLGSPLLSLTPTGNVGIGTTSPAVALELGKPKATNQIRLNPSDGNVDLRINSAFGSTDLAAVSVVSNHPLAFHTSNTERARIDSSGTFRVKGAGTAGITDAVQLNGSAPSNSLVIDSSGKVGINSNPDGTGILAIKQKTDATNGGLVIFATDGSGAVISRLTDGGLTFRNGGDERLRITSSGKVGIGATDPSATLEIGTAATTGKSLRLWSGGNNYLELSTANNSNGEHKITAGNSASGTAQLLFETASGGTEFERMRIDSSGNVGIGTTAPSSLLHSEGSSPDLTIRDTQSYTVSDGPLIQFQGRGPNATNYNFGYIRGVSSGANNAGILQFATNSAGTQSVALTIGSSGNVGIGTTSPVARLHANTAGGEGFRLTTASAQAGNVVLLAVAGVSNGYQITNDASNNINHIWHNAGGEKARIDSSGTFRVKGAGTAGITDAVQLNGSAPANSLLLDASGRLLVGTTATAGGNATVQIRNDAASDNLTLFRASTISAAAAPALRVARSRGTAASPTEVSSGDALGYVVFQGYDGAAYKDSAYIYAEADGTWTDGGDTTDNPSRLVFSTTVDGEGTPTARMTIKNDGKVGVGTSSPQAQLQVLDAIKVSDSAQSQGSIILGDGGSTAFGVGIARWNGGANAAGAGGMGYFAQGSVNAGGHFFYTGDAVAGSQTERLRITSDAYVRLASGSGGIQFNGDTAAANALDDYEEGTWTPVFIGTSTAGTPTYNTNGQAGKYTKVGNQVTAWAYLDVTALGGAAGNINITGLPFPISNTGFGASGISTGHADGTLGNSVRAYHNTTFLELRNNNSVVTAATGLIYVSVTYTT